MDCLAQASLWLHDGWASAIVHRWLRYGSDKQTATTQTPLWKADRIRILVTLRHTSGPLPGIKPESETSPEATYIDLSLLVTQEEVVHDGAIVEVLEGRHVLHASDAAVVHGLNLLPAQCILLVGVHLKKAPRTKKGFSPNILKHFKLAFTHFELSSVKV